MKKLLIAAIIVLFISGVGYFLKDYLGISIRGTSQYNFDYSKEEPPLPSVKPESITTTIKESPRTTTSIDYDKPIYSQPESSVYFPIWKKVFQTINSINDGYFDSHISVVRAVADEYREGEGAKLKKALSVTYYFRVDWAKVKLTDTFVYSVEGIRKDITAEELVKEINLPVHEQSTDYYVSFNRIEPITHIASQEQIKSAVKNASEKLEFDVNKDLGLSKEQFGAPGKLSMNLHGIIDYSQNKCISGTIVLQNASVIGVREGPCFVE